jgi:hypothetical protein
MSVAGSLQVQLDNMHDLNEQPFLQNLANHIVLSQGSPDNWGSGGTISDFGLATNNTNGLYELDLDKVSRLNSQNEFAVSYPQIATSTRLNNIKFGVSISQMLSINVSLLANQTAQGITSFSLGVQVLQDSRPLTASLHCYLVTTTNIAAIINETSSTGEGRVFVQIPESETAKALLVVFAQGAFDDRITSCAVYSFENQTTTYAPNNIYLALSPLNYNLHVSTNHTNVNTTKAYAFSYDYTTNLTKTLSNDYLIPAYVDNSPIVLAVQGNANSTSFIEWTTYPLIPLEFGSTFTNSEENVFSYPVSIRGTLCKLTLRFGDVD